MYKYIYNLNFNNSGNNMGNRVNTSSFIININFPGSNRGSMGNRGNKYNFI